MKLFCFSHVRLPSLLLNCEGCDERTYFRFHDGYFIRKKHKHLEERPSTRAKKIVPTKSGRLPQFQFDGQLLPLPQCLVDPGPLEVALCCREWNPISDGATFKIQSARITLRLIRFWTWSCCNRIFSAFTSNPPFTLLLPRSQSVQLRCL